MPFQHLLCAGGHLSHRILHILADITEALRHDANSHGHDRSQYDKDQRQLPAVVEHHHEQADNRRAFAHNGNQRAGRGRGNLLGVVGNT